MASCPNRKVPWRAGVVATITLAASVVVPTAARASWSTAAGPTLVASDAFSRGTSGGWGAADVGGSWVPRDHPGDFSVAGGAGQVGTPAGQSRQIWLPAVTAPAVETAVTFTTDRAASGNGQVVALVFRQVAEHTQYRAQVRFAAGTVLASAAREVDRRVTALGPEMRVPGLAYRAGTRLNIKAQAVSRWPTTVRIRIWPAGTAEPAAWQTSKTDVTPVLQQPGKVGLRTSSGAASGRVVTRFDDLRISTVPGLALPKPNYRQTVRVDVSKATADAVGGAAAARALVEGQVATINHRFNDPAVFAVTYDFVLTSFRVFSDSPDDHIFVTPAEDYKIVYDGFPSGVGGGWYGSYHTIYHAWTMDYDGGPFGADATDGVVHEFGHARGAMDVYATAVHADSNPVNGAEYVPPESIMNYPYGGETTWDVHSINLINRLGGAPIDDATYVDDVTTAFPPAISIRVLGPDGSPRSGASVKLYGSEWFSYAVLPTPIRAGSAGSTGTWTLPTNPFQPGPGAGAWDIRYATILVIAKSGDQSGYAWMPVTAAQNAYYASPQAMWTVTVHLGVAPPAPARPGLSGPLPYGGGPERAPVG